MSDDTIAALATAPGPSAVALLRISGPQSLAFLEQVSSRSVDWRACPRRQSLIGLLDLSGNEIDRVLATYFPSPKSYTGEDMVEIAAHGGPWVCRTLVETALEWGLRLARPGEFTQRAFLTGKMDLLQAEAVRDLIAGETAFQARVARLQIDGGLSRRLGPLKDELVGVITHLETRLEFVEEDVSPEGREELQTRLLGLSEGLRLFEEGFQIGRLVSDGFQVVLIGRTNVGKSSIFNCLMRFRRAIVTEAPGTTRDILTEKLEIGGLPVELVDTAGIREAVETVERIGVGKTIEYVAAGDVVLFVVDASQEFQADDHQVWAILKEREPILVLNKCDLPREVHLPREIEEGCWGVVEISAKDRQNIEGVTKAIWERASGSQGKRPAEEGLLVTNLRQFQCVRECRREIRKAAGSLGEGASEEYVVFHLRRALEAMGRLTGEFGVEDLLGEIFSTFCIGK